MRLPRRAVSKRGQSPAQPRLIRRKFAGRCRGTVPFSRGRPRLNPGLSAGSSPRCRGQSPFRHNPNQAPGGTQVFHTRFDRAADINYDGWPDGWTRRQGLGFPPYVRIEIRNEAAPGGGRPLAIALDGAGGIAYSPPVAVEPDLRLCGAGFVKTEGVEHDRAWLSLTLRDAERRILESFSSEKVGQTAGWQKVCLGPVSPKSTLMRSAVLGLHLEPSDREDLKATARFADLQLCRLPHLTLTLNRPLHFFTAADKVAATCEVSNPPPMSVRSPSNCWMRMPGRSPAVSNRCRRLRKPDRETSVETQAIIRGGFAIRGEKSIPTVSTRQSDGSAWPNGARRFPDRAFTVLPRR